MPMLRRLPRSGLGFHGTEGLYQFILNACILGGILLLLVVLSKTEVTCTPEAKTIVCSVAVLKLMERVSN